MLRRGKRQNQDCFTIIISIYVNTLRHETVIVTIPLVVMVLQVTVIVLAQSHIPKDQSKNHWSPRLVGEWLLEGAGLSIIVMLQTEFGAIQKPFCCTAD